MGKHISTYFWCFQGHRWENVHFSTKPRHVTPQIDCLRKMSPVLRVSTHIYCVSKNIDGKTFIFQSKPRHVTPQINSSWKNEHCSEGFNTHLWGFSGDIWENIFPHISGVSKDIGGKMFIFPLNLGM